MDAKTWQKIEEILDQALEMSPDERRQFVEESVSDSAIKKEVLSLLAAENSAPDYLDSGVDQFFQSDELIHDIADSLKDHQFCIDRYNITKELGRGGMSVVYLAERTDGEFKQQVAVKVMQPFGVNREDRFRRLRAERQILANLNHPNIARVFDGGITPEGWPYMVMELVDGVPVTRYCKDNNPGLEERLKLFCTICEAVNYAHQNLVLHRDLKPGNILITKDGQVKLLDFGIAKLLTDEQSSAPLTQTGLPLLTPEYAAPEQFRATSIATTIDVYSLGVILYELLAGVRPFDLSGKSFNKMEQTIREVEPQKPSEKATLKAIQAGVLKGDLDIICLKALRKEPDRRYGSVHDLKEDINRFLTGIPISARPATKSYRIKKFTQRHRTGITVAAAFLVVLSGFIALLINQQTITAQERDRAQLEAFKAQEVTDFMLSLFEANDPTESRGDTMTVNQFLERGIQRAERLHIQSDVQADMLEIIGRAYRNVSLFEQAEETLLNALEIKKKTFGEYHPQVAKTMIELGSAWTNLNKRKAADSLFHKALAIQIDFYPNRKHLDIASTLGSLSNNLIAMRRDSTDIQRAASYIEEAITIRRQFSEIPQPGLAKDLKTMAAVAHYQNNRGRQEQLLYDALDIEMDLLGEDHPETIGTLNSLGVFMYNSGRYSLAIQIHERVVDLRKKVFGEVHPLTATSYSSLAMAVMAERDFERAAQLFEQTMLIYQQAFGENNYRIAAVTNNVSQVYMNLGEAEKAIEMQEKALEINLMNYDELHHEVGSSYYLLSLSNRSIGDFDTAIEWAEKSLSISRRIGNDLYIGWDLILLASLHEEKKDFETAELLMLKGMEHERLALPEKHHHFASSNSRYARFLMARNRFDEAEPFLREALEIRIEHFGSEDLQSLQTTTLLGDCLISLGKLDEAELLLTTAHELSLENNFEEHAQLNLEKLIELYEKWQKPEEADRFRTALNQ